MGRSETIATESKVIATRKIQQQHFDGTSSTTEYAPRSESFLSRTGQESTARTLPDELYSNAEILEAATSTTPSGITLTSSTTRDSELEDIKNLCSLTQRTETLTINNLNWQSHFDASTNTFVFTSPEGRTTTTTIDDLLHPLSTEVAGLFSVNATFDTDGRPTEVVSGSGAEQRAGSIIYDDQGLPGRIIDALGRETEILRDPVGRPVQVTDPAGNVTTTSYDLNGNVLSVTPPGRPPHLFEYTLSNLGTEYAPPAVDQQDPATVYLRNLDEQIVQITRPDGQLLTMDYDFAGRLSSLNIPRGSITTSYYPDTGQVSSETDPSGVTCSFTYDGDLLTSESWSGAVSGPVDYTYDSFFSVATQSINGGNTISVSYDQDRLPVQIGAESISYSPLNGLPESLTLGNLTTTYTHNGFGELTVEQTANGSGATLYSNQYVRDLLGRVTTKTEVPPTGETTVFEYRYTTEGRLKEVVEDGEVVASYTYDPNGNRFSLTTPDATLTAVYDDQDRLLSYDDYDYTYNINGELETKTDTLTGEETIFSYDVLGNLMSVGLPDGDLVEYAVDPAGRRVARYVNGGFEKGWLYQDDLNPVAEVNASGQVTSRFVYGLKPNVPDYIVRGGETYKILSDQLGSVRLVVNASTGVIAQELQYDEFGVVLSDSNPGFQPFGFAGGLYDSDTGLVRFGARDYYGDTGRWTDKDPILFEGGMNHFLYADSDPVNMIDTEGTEAYVCGRPINLNPGLSNDIIRRLSQHAWLEIAKPGRRNRYGGVFTDSSNSKITVSKNGNKDDDSSTNPQAQCRPLNPPDGLTTRQFDRRLRRVADRLIRKRRAWEYSNEFFRPEGSANSNGVVKFIIRKAGGTSNYRINPYWTRIFYSNTPEK